MRWWGGGFFCGEWSSAQGFAPGWYQGLSFSIPPSSLADPLSQLLFLGCHLFDQLRRDAPPGVTICNPAQLLTQLLPARAALGTLLGQGSQTGGNLLTTGKARDEGGCRVHVLSPLPVSPWLSTAVRIPLTPCVPCSGPFLSGYGSSTVYGDRQRLPSLCGPTLSGLGRKSPSMAAGAGFTA